MHNSKKFKRKNQMNYFEKNDFFLKNKLKIINTLN